MWVYDLRGGLGGTGVLRSLSFMSVNDSPERHRGAGHPLISALSELQGPRGLGTRKRAAFQRRGGFLEGDVLKSSPGGSG